MRRLVLPLILAGSLVRLAGQGVEFDVASIKRNLGNDLPPGSVGGQVAPSGPNPTTGQIDFINVPARTLVLSAYPVATFPVEVVGLPGWADSERYDVMARARPRSSPQQLEQMWRALLTVRMKLSAHYETRPRPAYNLVLARADRALGAQLKPMDCSKPSGEPPNDLPQRTPLASDRGQSVMAICGARFSVGNTIYAGGINLDDLIALIIRAVGRPVVNRTGLEGVYSLKLTFLQREAAVASADDPPSIFTALEEQLGLKLESATTQGQVLVIDHVERPSEN
jgi:uncharacterized protein (TIGR03435 family)